ncbi:hypothetical protein NKJ70_32200, partial [Mesorhizobium sp. M0092]|uniref:hypothetical protein n=1 Tax=Mesorhizobium sp. M0092 TaxID=2956876 RepID=UPI00333BC8F5
SQGVHLFWWTPCASEHSTAKGAGKFALTIQKQRQNSRRDEIARDEKGIVETDLQMGHHNKGGCNRLSAGASEHHQELFVLASLSSVRLALRPLEAKKLPG